MNIRIQGYPSYKKILVSVFFIILIFTVLMSVAKAKGTSAGSIIINQASVSFTTNGVSNTLISDNQLQVAELIDVRVFPHEDNLTTVVNAQTNAVIGFNVVNTGNGSESFNLALNSLNNSEFKLDNIIVYVDDNGEPGLQIGSDSILYEGSFDERVSLGTITLDANNDLHPIDRDILISADIPDNQADQLASLVRLTATSSFSLLPEDQITSDKNSIDHGVGWLLGSSNGTADATSGYLLESIDVAMDKYIIDDTNNARNSGDIVNYGIDIIATGTGVINDLVITDPLPNDTSYIAGSLQLQVNELPVVSLTDIEDADAAEFSANQLKILLGNIEINSESIPPNRYKATIQFSTTVK